LERGQERIVPVHVPFDYPLPYLRGRRRLLKVKLVDVKVYCFPPVVESERFVGHHSGAWIDSTTLSDEEHAGLKEVANTQ
jgi:hypothetical protein